MTGKADEMLEVPFDKNWKRHVRVMPTPGLFGYYHERKSNEITTVHIRKNATPSNADRSTISYFITRNQLQDEPHLGENKSPNHESTRKLDLLPSDSHAQLRNNISNYSVVCILGMLCRSYLQYFLQKSSRACLLRLQ